MTVHNSITETIGNTPIVKLEGVLPNNKIEVYVKLEYMNPFGSIKDRVAWKLMEDDLEEIKEQDKTLLESSSGNTGKAIQAIAGRHGIDFKNVTNRVKVDEVKDILITMGCNMEELPGESECPDPNNPDNPLNKLEEIKETNPEKYYRTRQYNSEENTQAHYQGTGKEIQNDLQEIKYLVGGLGTTGSTKGVAQRLKEHNDKLTTIGVVSSSEDFIPGIRSSEELWEVDLYNKEIYQEVEEVTSTEAIEEMLNLIRNHGILAGPTTGANLKALKNQLKDKNPEETQKAVFFACDRFEHYISYIKKRKPEIYGQNKQLKDHYEITEEEIQQHAEEITVEEAEKEIKENPSTLVIDTRSPTAFKYGHIDGSINIPETHFKEILDHGEPFCKDKDVIMVCSIGEVTQKYSAILNKRGYQTKTLQDGINAWKNQLDTKLAKNI